ncbi:PREDICTED: PRELI domain containing protein 3A isoform X7 [Hipposideros armiger]|nr:PREDICTED: PRELI domain containing protein 3A isoform X7 [Hipposideros armiger]
MANTISSNAKKVQKNVLCGYLAGVSNGTMSNTPKKRKPIRPKIVRYDWSPDWSRSEYEEPPMIEMSNLSFQPVCPKPTTSSASRMVTPRMKSASLPTWGQLKKLTQVAEHRLMEENIPKIETNMLVSMLAVFTVENSLLIRLQKWLNALNVVYICLNPQFLEPPMTRL